MRALDSTQRACEGRAAASLLQLAVPTRRFDRKYRARVLAHSLHALSSESFKNACFKLRQGNIESKTLDTKNFLKKLPLVVLFATRTRETSDGVIRTYELEYTDRYMHRNAWIDALVLISIHRLH